MDLQGVEPIPYLVVPKPHSFPRQTPQVFAFLAWHPLYFSFMEKTQRNLGAEKLLREREGQGLKFCLYFTMAMMVFFIAITLVSFGTPFELVTVLGFCLLGLLVPPFFISLVSKNKGLVLGGWITVLVYLGTDFALPWIWYHSLGGDSIPKGVLSKSVVTQVSYVFLVLCSLPGKPIYTLVYALGSTANLVFLLVVGLVDPDTVQSDSIASSLVGPSISLLPAWLSIAFNLATGLLMTVFLYRYRSTVINASTAEHANSQLGRYFSPGLVPMIASSDSDFLKPGGKLQEVTVLFSDIRNFTGISESLEPGRVVELLSLYQEKMVQAIFEFGGTLDKFIGDGIMATFGTPVPLPDDTIRAVQAGMAMQEGLKTLNLTLASRGLPLLEHGIGIHSGPVIAGNVGTSNRLEYTVIGDSVNTASRIESLCKTTGESLLVSERVATALEGRFQVSPRGKMNLKGKMDSLSVYVVTGKA